MHPIFLELGPLTIRYYGLMAAIGFLAAIWLININKRFANLSAEQSCNMVFIAMISGVLGSRILYVIQFWEQFRGNYGKIIRIDQGGLVYFGGFILAVITLIIYCKKHQLDMVRVLDVIVPSLAIGHAFGRIGCFLNGCCFGKVTTSCLGVKYPIYSEAYNRYGDVFLHPVQLYEAFLNIIIASLAFVILRKCKRGMTTSFYLIAYGVMRFLDEYFRGDHRFKGIFTMSQIIGLGLILIGVITVIIFKKKNRQA